MAQVKSSLLSTIIKRNGAVVPFNALNGTTAPFRFIIVLNSEDFTCAIDINKLY